MGIPTSIPTKVINWMAIKPPSHARTCITRSGAAGRAVDENALAVKCPRISLLGYHCNFTNRSRAASCLVLWKQSTSFNASREKYDMVLTNLVEFIGMKKQKVECLSTWRYKVRQRRKRRKRVQTIAKKRTLSGIYISADGNEKRFFICITQCWNRVLCLNAYSRIITCMFRNSSIF